MKLSPFMKEHKENLKRLTKKQLIQQNLMSIEISSQIDIEKDKAINDLKIQNKTIDGYLRSAENALDYKEKVIEKYKSLLSYSVEDL